METTLREANGSQSEEVKKLKERLKKAVKEKDSCYSEFNRVVHVVRNFMQAYIHNALKLVYILFH